MLRRALAAALLLAAGVVTSAAGGPLHETVVLSASAQGDLIALINGYRAENGLQPVSAHGALTAAAAWMARDMAARNYVAHVSSDGRSPTERMAAFGYPATSMYTGEDLGAGYGAASAVLAGWQASAAHNAVLLNPNYNAVGVGLVYDPNANYRWYWAADFGGPGGTVKTVATPAAQSASERAVSAPRAAPAPVAGETIGAAGGAQRPRTVLIEASARQITSAFAVLHRMGAI